MTITAKTTFTAPKRKTSFISTLEDGRPVRATQHTDGVRIGGGRDVNVIRYDEIEAYIELLFAVKADRDATAEFEKKWRDEHAEVDIHTLEATA